jgi:ferric-dicitrate binding protein FerR (iron transport regulator)
MSWKVENTSMSSESVKSKIWGNIESKIQSTPEKKVKGKTIKLNFLISAAASIAILLIAGMFFMFPKFHTRLSENEMQIVRNVTKNALMVALPDRSHVWLNKKASLSFAKKAKDFKRSVKLTGEAYFEVSHNPAKPFTVFSDAGLVRVLGTSFNINPSLNGKTIIDVYTGRVKCVLKKDSSKQITLIGGQRGILTPAENKIEKDSVCDINSLAWKTGKIAFHNSSLQKVCLTLSTYFDTTITCSTEVSNLSLNVQFNHPRIDDALKVIGITLDLQVKVDNKGLVFKETQ